MSATAVILLGFQNDFFASDGILHGTVKENLEGNRVLENTLRLLDRLVETDALLITTPISFASEEKDFDTPRGLMSTIRDLGAFRSNDFGGAMVPELERYGDRIIEITGKHGFNAFHNTQLNDMLREKGVKHVAIVGVVTSICVDSTGRSASEKGFDVTILSDCTAGRSGFEHEFYCSDIFPLYAEVATSDEFLERVGVGSENIALSS